MITMACILLLFIFLALLVIVFMGVISASPTLLAVLLLILLDVGVFSLIKFFANK